MKLLHNNLLHVFKCFFIFMVVMNSFYFTLAIQQNIFSLAIILENSSMYNWENIRPVAWLLVVIHSQSSTLMDMTCNYQMIQDLYIPDFKKSCQEYLTTVQITPHRVLVPACVYNTTWAITRNNVNVCTTLVRKLLNWNCQLFSNCSAAAHLNTWLVCLWQFFVLLYSAYYIQSLS